MDEQLNDSRGKISELESLLAESEGKNVKAAAEAANLLQQLGEVEHKLGITTKNMKSLDSQLTDAKSACDDESKVKRENECCSLSSQAGYLKLDVSLFFFLFFLLLAFFL